MAELLPPPDGPGADADAGVARLWTLVGSAVVGTAALTLLLGGATLLATRGALLGSFRDIGASLPALSQAVLAGWYAVVWSLPQLLLLAVAMVFKGPLRAVVAGVSLVYGLLGLGLFVVGAWLPFFTLSSVV